jgi:exonuclease VII small subunit
MGLGDAVAGIRKLKGAKQMWKDANNDVAPQRMTEALTAYEEAVKEFSTSATEFLKHVPLLTKARDAYRRAMVVSTQLREILNNGDETLRAFMAQMQHAVNFQIDNAASGERKGEAVKIETIKASGEKADAARA